MATALSETPAQFPRIDHPAAWTAAEVGGREGLEHRLSPAQADALRGLARTLEGRDVASITRADADDPAIVDLMAAVRFELQRGKGGMILSGLDLEDLSEDAFSRLFWALGTHLGIGAVQSARRDLIGRVEKLEDNPAGRGYQSDIELSSHCDFHEFLALACYRAADEGGESGLVSSLAIHDVMARERPDLLALLYRGFPHQSADDSDRTPHDVPVFCEVDGTVSAYFHMLFYVNAARGLGREIPADLREALSYMSACAKRPELKASFQLAPGEMVFWHNFVNLHSRTNFTDRPDHRRLLFRLWLHARPGEGRPMHPDFLKRAQLMDVVHSEGRPALVYRLDEIRPR
ncbi:MAG: TauD/TfdA family dioxygenase [Sphingomonas fennica]